VVVSPSALHQLPAIPFRASSVCRKQQIPKPHITLQDLSSLALLIANFGEQVQIRGGSGFASQSYTKQKFSDL